MTRPNGVADPDGDLLDALRLRLRIPMFTAMSLGLGVFAHVAAGGSLPGAAMMLLLVAIVVLASASLMRRERGLCPIVLAVGLVQVGMHVALLARHEQVKPEALDNGPGLLLAHAVAVGALAWWLRRGEAAAWRAAVRVLRCRVRWPWVLGSPSASLLDRPAPPDASSITSALTLLLPVRGPPCLA